MKSKVDAYARYIIRMRASDMFSFPALSKWYELRYDTRSVKPYGNFGKVWDFGASHERDAVLTRHGLVL